MPWGPEAGSPRAGVLGSCVLSDMGPRQHLLLTPKPFLLPCIFYSWGFICLFLLLFFFPLVEFGKFNAGSDTFYFCLLESS